jgi:hypothetical protein
MEITGLYVVIMGATLSISAALWGVTQAINSVARAIREKDKDAG